MTEPRDPMPPAVNRGHLLASDADRDQVIGSLKAAYVQGRLTKDELEVRVGEALASRTYAQLAVHTADLPTGLADPPTGPASRPASRAPAARERRVLRPGVAKITATVFYAGMWPLAAVLPTDSEGEPTVGIQLIGAATLIYLLVFTLACVWAQALGPSREEHSSGQIGGPATGAGDQVPGRLAAADPGRQLPAADPGRWNAAEARRQRPTRAAPIGLCQN